MENQDNYNNELIYGIHPVLEALEAGKTLDKIFILNTLQTPQSKIITTYARDKKISLNRVPLAKLQKMTRQNHQGVVAFMAPIDFLDLETQSALVDATRHPNFVFAGQNLFVNGDIEVATIQDFTTQSSFEDLAQVKFSALVQGYQPKNSTCVNC